jgi:HD-GYP domain-containing protein (c-di-GMP phosphodiesterase class II)
MTAGRAYQHEMTRDEAIAELKRCSGTHFDESIVNTFTEMLMNKEDL